MDSSLAEGSEGKVGSNHAGAVLHDAQSHSVTLMRGRWQAGAVIANGKDRPAAGVGQLNFYAR